MSDGHSLLVLEEVLPNLRTITDLRPLASAAREADVDAGILTDEEVHLIGPDPMAPPDGFIDAPRLAELPAHDQEVALEAVRLLLEARGDVIHDPSEDLDRAVGAHAVISEVRNAPQAVVSVRVDVRGEGTRRAAIYRALPDLFLVEEVHDAGLHHFAFRSPPRTAAWLASAVDPFARAARTTAPDRSSDVDASEARSQRLAAASETSALVYSASHDPDDARSFTCYSGQDGVHVLFGWRSAEAGQVMVQELGPGDLVAFCAAFLVPDLAGSAG